MKKIVLLLISVVALISSLAFFGTGAYTGTQYGSTGIYYQISNGAVSITDSNSSVTTANIPSTIKGYPVTSIGEYAFAYCYELVSITIPNSVKSIGSYAFHNCTRLTSVTIPNSVKSIGTSAFDNCTGLTSITIPNSVTSIGSWAFFGCSGLTRITIGNSVTSIGNKAFYECTGLTSITIPNSVTSIGEGAFEHCRGLTSISLPFVGDKPYQSTDTYQYPFGYIFGASSYTGGISTRQDFYGSSSESTTYGIYYIPSSLKTVKITGSSYIPGGAFQNCSNITNITIPNSVTSIGSFTFYGCTGLTSITIGNSVTSIGYCAFSGCTGLTSITIPDSVTSIGDFAFHVCTGLTSITIPDSVTSIGRCAFQYCSGLTSITIPDSVTSIGNYAFSRCSKLTSITIPNSVTSIGNYAFEYCSGLTSITIGNKNCEISGMPSSVTIRCPHDSKALDYAKRYGNKYELTDSHTLVVLSKVPATCTTDGKTEGKKCSSCGEIIEVQKSIPALGHAYKDVVKTKATFGKNGKIESTCQYCGEVRSTKTIKAICAILQPEDNYDDSDYSYCYQYTGKAITPTIEVYDSAGKVISSKYYTVSYSNNVDIGTGIITVKFKGNYTGTAEEYFDIYCDHVYKKTVTKATLTKDGKTVKTCTNCGKKSTTVIPKIKTVALSATTYTCNNSERKPSVTVKDTKGKVLKKGTDYSVSYSSGRIKPGTYTVTVTFKGNYSGSKKLSYKIGLATVTGLKQTSGKGLCLTWNKVPGATGYIIQQYVSSEKKYKDVKTVSTNSYKNSNISKGKTAKVRIIATYGSVKSGPSSAISAKAK